MADIMSTTLETLPQELLIHIGHSLEKQRSLSRLSRTCRHLYTILNPVLYVRDRNEHDGVSAIWAANKGMLETIHHAGRAGCFDSDSGASKQRQKPLYCAVEKHHHEIIKVLLDQYNVSVDETGISGQTALFGAAFADDPEAAQILIDHGADVNRQDYLGQRPLVAASARGSVKMVRLLLDHGSQVNAAGNDFTTAIQHAIGHHHEATCRLLIDSGANVSETVDGISLLHMAVNIQDAAIVQLLLDSGIQVDAVDSEGQTPLWEAVNNGSTSIAKALVEAGANVNAVDFDQSLVLAAVRQHDADTLKLLLENGAEPNFGSPTGWSPLSLASAHGVEDIVRLLLEHGASVDGSDAYRDVPLINAAMYDETDAMRVLVSFGADTEATYSEGQTALLVAAERGNLGAIKTLVDLNASIHSTDAIGRQFTHIAAQNGNTDVLDFIREMGNVNLNVQDLDGRTPILYTSMSGPLSVMKQLVDLGADVNIADRYGNTPLAMAVRNGHVDMADFLLKQHEIDVSLKDSVGRSVFWGAGRCGKPSMVDMLQKYANNAHVHIDEDDLLLKDRDVVRFVPETCFCDACGRCRVHGYESMGCSQCHPDTFIICSECLDLGMKCRDESHELESHWCEFDEGGSEAEETEEDAMASIGQSVVEVAEAEPDEFAIFNDNGAPLK